MASGGEPNLSGFVRADGVYEAIQTRFKNESSSVSFLTSLAKMSRSYTATFNADSEFWNDYSPTARKYLEDFNSFDLKPMRPLLLAIAANFKKKEFEKSIKLMNSLSVHLILSARTRSGTNEQTFADAAIRIARDEISNCEGLTDALKKIFPSDKEFEEIFRDARVSKAAFARYILRELEHSVAPAKSEEDDLSP